MELIQTNPYRIAGILSNATLSQLQKNKSQFPRHIEIGRQPKSNTDFESILGEIIRTKENLQKAFANLEKGQDKVNYALFWFLNASPFDNTALEYLKNGDKEKAIEIWEKRTQNKEVNSKNYSAFNNLGTLCLLSQNKAEIKRGIESKIKLIESEYFENFIHSVADEFYTIDKGKQSEKLIDDLLTELTKQYSSSETLQFFSSCNVITQKYLSKKFTEQPLHHIESQIESCKKKRKANSKNAFEFGLRLVSDSKDDLSLLNSLLGTSDFKYKTIADQLASEIMQCGIDYFNKNKENNYSGNYLEKAQKLTKIADRIAVGKLTKDRIKENIEELQELAKTAPIKEDLAFITRKLKSFQNSSDTISNAKSLVSSCKNRLQNIRIILGSNDEFYLNISSAVVSNALGMVIEVVNEAQSGLEYNRAKLILLPDIVSNAVSAISAMGSLDMNSQTRVRYIENKATINNINKQLKDFRRSIPSQSTTTSSSSSSWAEENPGCIIVIIIIVIIMIANS